MVVQVFESAQQVQEFLRCFIRWNGEAAPVAKQQADPDRFEGRRRILGPHHAIDQQANGVARHRAIRADLGKIQLPPRVREIVIVIVGQPEADPFHGQGMVKEFGEGIRAFPVETIHAEFTRQTESRVESLRAILGNEEGNLGNQTDLGRRPIALVVAVGDQAVFTGDIGADTVADQLDTDRDPGRVHRHG